MAVHGASQLTDNDDNQSTLSTSSRPRFRLQSSSWSAWAAKIPSKVFLNTKSNQLPRSFSRKRKAKRSVTFEDTLGSDEVRQELGLSAEDPRSPGIYQKPAPGEFQAHKRPTSEENSRASINEHGEGTVRLKDTIHRRQMRTVSQDDYLLARGANPRTGIISPSVATPGHSIESSSDEQEALQARTVAGESKWRQNGDQWISLGLDEPTPTGSPPKLDAFVAIPAQHKIQRKPVGSAPRRDSHDRERSSSAPTPQKFKYFWPGDVGGGLSDGSQKSFLGQVREYQVFDVPNTDLRCPPMNSIQSRSPLSNQTRMSISRGGYAPIPMQKLSGPLTGDPSYPHLRYQKPEIPPRRHHLIQDLQAEQRITSTTKPLRNQRDIQIVHPPFQPRSLRGMISGPWETVVLEGSHQQHGANDIHTKPGTISMNTDTLIPSSTNRKRLRKEQNPSENMSLPMNRSRPRGMFRPHMHERSDGMTDVPKVSLHTPDHHQLSQIGTRGGVASTGNMLKVDRDGKACIPKKTMRFRVNSFEDKLRNTAGSIRTFDGPAEAEANVDDDTAPSLVATDSDTSGHAITAARRAMGYQDYIISHEGNEATGPEGVGNDTSRCATTDTKQAMSSRDRILSYLDGTITACPRAVGSDVPQRAITILTRASSLRGRVLGVEESTVAYLKPLSIGFLGKLEAMVYCIVGTMRRVLRISYVYSETGRLKIEGMLVMDILRSAVYTLILGAIAVALAKIVSVVVRVGACIVWVFRGLLWVLMEV